LEGTANALNDSSIVIMKNIRAQIIFSFIKVFFTFLFFITSSELFSQQNKIIFDHYSYNEGFYSREAMQTCATSNGMIWVTSNDGLVRFDSKRFKFYQHSQGDSTSLYNNYCTALIADKRDWLWLISNKRLEIFNTLNEKFTPVKFRDTEISMNTTIYCMNYDSAHDIVWVGAENGLYFSKNGSTQLEKVINGNGATIFKNLAIHSILQEGNNTLWITSGAKIIKYTIATQSIEIVEVPNLIDGIKNIKNVTELTCCYLQKNGTMWLGTSGSGLIEYNTGTKAFHQYVFSDYEKAANIVMSIAQTNLAGEENVLWISTADIGLQSFNSSTKKFISYDSQFENDKYTIKKGNTYGFCVQPNKALWIGSSNGLHKYDFNKQLFKKIDLTPIANGVDLLPVGSIAAVKNENKTDDKLWFHIPYHGGHVYSITKNLFEKMPAKVAKYFQYSTAFWDVFIDKNNIAWIATGQYGLVGYDISIQKIIVPEKKYFFKDWEWVNGFFEDKYGAIWLQTFKGLFKIDGVTHEITEIREVNELLNKEGLSQSIVDIDDDDKGTIWFITDSEGNGKSCVAAYYPNTKKVKIVFNGKSIQTTNHADFDLRSIVYKNKKLFIANYTNGLMVIDDSSTNNAFRFLNKEQGVLNTYMGSLIKDSIDNIWISNGIGISLYNDNRRIFSNYASSSYSLGNDDQPYMYLSKQSNNLYLGQINAIDYFNIYTPQPKNDATLLFTGVKIFNKEYSSNKFSLADGDQIILSHLQNMINVEFALLSYTNATDNMYSWKLEGLEKDWNTSRENIASYTNLKPGTYTLLVKAANSFGEWTNQPIKLIFKIKAPFYNKWWFYLLCILLIAAVIFWFTQLRINRIKERNRLRNKIASDLHDEIGSTLTSINILSNVSQQAMEHQPLQAKEMLNQIALQSKAIQQSMSDIVWSLRNENEYIESLVARMREYAAQTLEPLNINVQVNAATLIEEEKLPIQYRKEMLLIFKEATNNIAKHAGANSVTVHLNKTLKNIELTIFDNGIWKGNTTGTGTKSMQERAEALGGTLAINTSEDGTTVKLIIPIP
jgi:two-component sensor histidine kinase